VLKSELLTAYYAGDKSNVPVVDHLGVASDQASDVVNEYGIQVVFNGETQECKVDAGFPPVNSWLQSLAGLISARSVPYFSHHCARQELH
jgi:hypothetical protein